VEKREQAYAIMQHDLASQFGYSGKIEKRKLKCLFLVRLSGEDNLKAKGDITRNNLGNYSTDGDTVRTFERSNMGAITNQLNWRFSEYISLPVFDKTGYKQDIDIKIRDKSLFPLNPKELKKDLRAYGLDLVEGEEWMDVLVIKENSH
jgi:hypothetical protein